MAEIGKVMEDNADKFDEESKTKATESFNSIQKTLGDLGFDVLINPREGDVDFVEYGRFSQVIGQRDTFKNDLAASNTTLETMKLAAKDNPEVQKQLQLMIDTNEKLMGDNDKMSMDNAIIMAARDAIDPSDVLLFIDRSGIKKDSKGNYKNIDKEMETLRTAKPHLFKATKKKAGNDPNNNLGGEQGKVSMNSLIRAAAGYTRTF